MYRLQRTFSESERTVKIKGLSERLKMTDGAIRTFKNEVLAIGENNDTY